MFPGFSEEASKFLRGLARHNDREWFQERKDLFERECKRPMEALVEAINAQLVKLAPAYMTEPKKAVFRIYRDTRFTNDKRPYKTHLGAWFGRAGLTGKSAAGFYFHLAGDGFLVAGGCYMPPPDQLRAIRLHLLDHHQRLRQLTATARFRALQEFDGESLARDPKGFPKDHPASDLIRRKQWGWHSSLDLATAQSPQLVAEIVRRFTLLAPVVELLNEPFTHRPARREVFFE